MSIEQYFSQCADVDFNFLTVNIVVMAVTISGSQSSKWSNLGSRLSSSIVHCGRLRILLGITVLLLVAVALLTVYH